MNEIDEEKVYEEFEKALAEAIGIYEEVNRPEKILVRYMDEYYSAHEETLEGLAARIYQHEYDHLQGILFIDKLNPLRRKLLRSRLNEISGTR